MRVFTEITMLNRNYNVKYDMFEIYALHVQTRIRSNYLYYHIGYILLLFWIFWDIGYRFCVLLRGQGRQIFELFIYWAISRALVGLIKQFKQHVKPDTFLY